MERRFDERVDIGSYYHTYRSSEEMGGSCPSSSGEVCSRGVRGPIDRFFQSKGNDNEHEKRHNVPPPPKDVKEASELVTMDIGRFFFENGIPFNVAASTSFASMCRSIGDYGQGYKVPSPRDLSTWVLKKEVETTKKIVDDVKKTWKTTGVTLMLDGWTDIRGRSLLNFLVNNPKGTVFLKSIDASDVVKDVDLIFKLLDDVVEEIGEDIIVQVVTDNASVYKAAGRLLMEKRKHMYWTPCAAHCIDLILEDIGKLTQHKHALLKARKVSNYIYKHGWVLALMREHTKCELIRPAATRFATSYLTLQSMYQLKQPLEAMFVSEKWASSIYAKKKEGKEVRNIVLREKHFWPSVVYAIKTTRPLIKVLRLVVGDEPAIGFLYDAIDEAKEKISKNLKGESSAYKKVWDIIDKRWEFQLHRHLYAAAYFMNPQFQYSDNFSTHSEIRSGLYHVMDKLIVDPEERELANIQLDAFVDKRGVFGYSIAQSTIKKRSPTDWWNAFGHETPDLKKFAVKVLSLTCVASVCERNWSTFNQVHTKKRNRLTTLKMHKLVYIMYNKRLKDRHLRRQKLKENEDPLLIDHVPSDDEWLVGEEDELRNDGDDDLDLDIFDGGDVTSRDGSHGTSSKKTKGHPTKDRDVISRDGNHGTSSKKRKGHPTKDKGLSLIDEEDEWIDPNTDESSLDLSSDE